ncbi:unnamed protein product [Strongylus vulgaris]|uniref:Apple domain-containing protein n=1 Tax=Strongylus vulgaris TaxID=40348 RepID=A0A3P7JA70_STRVU|nr:unnamed protein product [Strongylus vulgaris]
METLTACADYCIMAAGNRRKKDPLCRSFTYNIPRKTCRLYDHDGMKSTATIETERSSIPYWNRNIPKEIVDAPSRNLQVLQKKATKELNTIEKSTEEVITSESCLTNNAYYVVIGNEIVRPISNGGEVKVYNDVDQGNCANFCSNNQGPDQEQLICNSLNYFPISRKCELYSILAEPHGPGSLVENQDVIYAEKFCLPETTQRCQNDEIFILHVQKSLSGIPIHQTTSNSITSCLRSCLNAYACKTAVFDSTKQQCHLYKEGVSASDRDVVDTPPGFVMIENGCAERGGSGSKARAAKTLETDTSSEWSGCNFRINGVRVKAAFTIDFPLIGIVSVFVP